MYISHESKYHLKFYEYLKLVIKETMPDYEPMVNYEGYQADVFLRLSKKELKDESAVN